MVPERRRKLTCIRLRGNLGTRYIRPCLVGDGLHLRGIPAGLFPLFVLYGLIVRGERDDRDRNAGISAHDGFMRNSAG